MNKLFHSIVFKLPNLNKLFYEFEKKEAKIKSFERIIISGLARSGTTSLLRELVNNDISCSLTYRNMPLILAPKMQNLLNYFSKVNENYFERSHNDGIMINEYSSEAFDEVFFQVYEGNRYIFKNHLNEYHSKYINDYIEYINYFLYLNNKNIYICKNNNHIVRLPQIIESKKFKVFITFRKPLTHVSSLANQDLIHKNLQIKDNFILDYMNYLGHFEFGRNKKHFNFYSSKLNILDYAGNDFWLVMWINYYDYLLTLLKKYDNINLIFFEDWCTKDKLLLNYIEKITGISVNNKNIYSVPNKETFPVNDNLLIIAENIFKELQIKYKIQLF
jgi:hypothetical protein